MDLADTPVRDLNQATRTTPRTASPGRSPPRAASTASPSASTPTIDVTLDGHAGYYAAGMHQKGQVTINGNAGVGPRREHHVRQGARQGRRLAVRRRPPAHGGLVVIDGNAGARCGISMKGVDIVVGGNIGHMSAFMAQAGRLVVCGDAGDALGDSIYEARIYVKRHRGFASARTASKSR